MEKRNERARKAVLILESGDRFEGTLFGKGKEAAGTVVFSNGTANAQSALTDPANTGKILVMTNPAVGNFGMNLEDMEADAITAAGLIVREKCDRPSNWRCEMELDAFLRQQQTPGVEGVDTRAITRLLCRKGSMKGVIINDEYISEGELARRFARIGEAPATPKTSDRKPRHIQGKGPRIAVLDLGVCKHVLRRLRREDTDASLSVFPASATYSDIIAAKPGAVLLTNGPSDFGEALANNLTETVKQLLQDVPVFAMGFGGVMLGMALGARAERLPYGHHGSGFTVKSGDGLLYVTAQNHDYTITDAAGLSIDFRNVNDGTAEGFSYTKDGGLRAKAVLFDPDTETAHNRNTGFFYDELAAAALKRG